MNRPDDPTATQHLEEALRRAFGQLDDSPSVWPAVARRLDEISMPAPMRPGTVCLLRRLTAVAAVVLATLGALHLVVDHPHRILPHPPVTPSSSTDGNLVSRLFNVDETLVSMSDESSILDAWFDEEAQR